jgi:hypothetical protein
MVSSSFNHLLINLLAFLHTTGRAPLPTPLMSEEEWLKNGGLNNVKSGNIDDDNNDFVFNYGFNPIKYLAEYIQWSHPDGILIFHLIC